MPCARKPDRSTKVAGSVESYKISSGACTLSITKQSLHCTCIVPRLTVMMS